MPSPGKARKVSTYHADSFVAVEYDVRKRDCATFNVHATTLQQDKLIQWGLSSGAMDESSGNGRRRALTEACAHNQSTVIPLGPWIGGRKASTHPPLQDRSKVAT